MDSVLLAEQLTFGPSDRRRIDSLDLQLSAGERLGVLGINGAGKSTLLQLLAGVLVPDAGRVRVLGDVLHGDDVTVRRHIGFLPQRVPAYDELSTRENLIWAGQLRDLRGHALDEAVDRVLGVTGLRDVAQRLAGRLSAGMRQRLGVAQALIHRPSILLLDEPTAGLDPLQTDDLRDLLASLPGTTALLIATHLLDDVQRLCGRVLLLDAGRRVGAHAVDAGTDLLAEFRRLRSVTKTGRC